MMMVLKQLVQFLKYFTFWLVFFLVAKATFLVYNLDQTSRLTMGEVLGIFSHGLIMDVSTACYLLVIPGLLFVLLFLLSSNFVNRFLWIYTIIFISIASFLIVLDLGLYPHWGTRVNITAFNYIDDPVAMSASVSIVDVIKGFFIAGCFIAASLYFYRWLFPEGVVSNTKGKWYIPLIQLFIVATLIIPIRGGFDTAPMNLSSVAFSPKLYVNQAASNYLWNFAKSVEKRKRLSNPCNYMPKAESERIFNASFQADTLIEKPRLIRADASNPNVILIILEGISDKVIEGLGGLKGISPNLDSLCAKSTVFTNFYATGNRSDRGISGVLGSYPSLLSTSIMVYPEKSRSLTLLPEYFNREGYHTSFYYGGDINFYNLKTFVLQSNCGKIITKADFPSELGRMSKWGVPDGYVFERALADLKNEKQPFMKTIYTVSSHPPYDVPFSKIKGNALQEKYLNSVAYTDSCLGKFIDELRKSPLWDNTLFIVTSDHGHMEPGPTDITDPATYRIPLIWSGGAVDSIRRIDAITQQIDFGPTLIHQLGWKADSSRFAKDFFSSHSYAFYMLDSGWGYITPEGRYYFDQNKGDFVTRPEAGIQSIDPEFPKAYLQVLHDDFISR
jgi:phosphoglycerol transferase MdoB-like AlkP superfamily enzyme